ncbi:hypothetical protein QTA58_15365 [Neorhizobium sp. CSC1952]|uniref:hypothetical protein n=1 Tax=Neorhizobium sp. CSC1952 TaxID=2978974 RepID=UPI0025A5E573|nr:hypothetical protein [Rhizobium sp. CSC1952]WJR65609.1 hypothetical protein QTA58_15365 [Rhizobium sp. CSC1952]
MEIGGIGRNYPARPARADSASASTDAASAADAQKTPVEEQYDRLTHGLTTLKKATDEADEEAKARARKKLEEAKEQLKFLQRWNFDPETVARQAALLGVVVAGAAREFTEALTEDGATFPSSTKNRQALTDETQQAGAEDMSNEEKPYSQAERAYMDVMDDGGSADEKPTLSPGDIRTAAEFSAVARQIKALLEEAARKLRDDRNAGAATNAQGLDAAVSALAGTVSSMPAVSVSITV